MSEANYQLLSLPAFEVSLGPRGLKLRNTAGALSLEPRPAKAGRLSP